MSGGFVGSIAVLMIYGSVLWFTEAYRGLPLYHYAIIGAITGIVSQIGDLTASAIKRYAGIKVSGKIIPGHGGILDRRAAIYLQSRWYTIICCFAE